VKRRRKLGFFVVVAVGIGTTFWLVLPPRDPVYQGQTLSYWFDQFNTTNRPQAALAIRQIGTNAVPFLLEKAKSEDGDTLYERVYRTIYYRAPTILQRRLPLPKPIENNYNYRVASALQLLGVPALPLLIEAMGDKHPKVRLAAVRVTGLIGLEANAAVPTLAKLVGDPNAEVRVMAVCALSAMGPNKRLAIEALIGALNDSNRGPKPGMTLYVKESAARVLGEIGPEARAAVSPLTRLLGDTNSYTRVRAAIALWRINRDTNVIPVLYAELESASEAPAYGRILTALRQMGPSAMAAVPVIIKTIKDQRGKPNNHDIDLLKALEELYPEAATKAGMK